MSPLPRQGWLFLIEFLKWYFSRYWQVRTRRVFAQTVTFAAPGFKILEYQLVIYVQSIMSIFTAAEFKVGVDRALVSA